MNKHVFVMILRNMEPIYYNRFISPNKPTKFQNSTSTGFEISCLLEAIMSVKNGHNSGTTSPTET